MSWDYSQGGGVLRFYGNVRYSNGYSGAWHAVNDPSYENMPFEGPIPRGRYRMKVRPSPHPRFAPPVIELTPEGHNALGRTEFLIHGDNKYLNGTASEGCIILPLGIRKQIANSMASGINDLLEVSS